MLLGTLIFLILIVFDRVRVDEKGLYIIIKKGRREC